LNAKFESDKNSLIGKLAEKDGGDNPDIYEVGNFYKLDIIH